jgi:ferritin
MKVIESNKGIPGSNNPATESNQPYQEAQQLVEANKGSQTMSGTEEAIRKARRKCTISDNMVKLLCTQMRAELSNYTLYNSFASYYNGEGLYKIAEYWLARADEENVHHKWIRNYLNMCDAVIEYPEIPPTKVDITDKVAPFADTVDREIETTGGINLLVNEAMKESDWATVKFLMGDDDESGQLVKEQVDIIFCLEV